MHTPTTKISFLGDVTCDRPLLEACRMQPGEYAFADVFSVVKGLLAESDYAVANFETVCAGSSDDYRTGYLLYNCPDQIVLDMKAGGIDFVTTANNHCLDQGIDGLVRTIEVLDKYNVAHTGTFLDQESREAVNVITVNGLRIAILAYTSETNASNTGIVLDDSNEYRVGLLRKQVDRSKQYKGLKGLLARTLSSEQKRLLQRVVSRAKLKLGISYFKPYTDHITDADTSNNPYLIQARREIAKARCDVDVVVVCPHIGGQFNTSPGTYSSFIINYFKECGADIIVGNHPHVVQRANFNSGRVEAYSLGSFNLSVSADYIVHDSLPEYSMILHVYINNENGKIAKVAFSILKIIEDERHRIVVYPIDELPERIADSRTRREITAIYNRITGKNIDLVDIMREYDLCE